MIGIRHQGRPLRSPADYALVSVLVVGAGLVPARLPGHETKLGGRAQGPPLRQEGRFPCVRATGRRGRRPLRHCHKISACPGKRTTARVAPTAYYRRWGGQRRQGRLRPGIRGGGSGGGGGGGGGVQAPGPQGVPGLWGGRGGGGGGKGRLGRPRRSQTASKCRRPR